MENHRKTMGTSTGKPKDNHKKTLGQTARTVVKQMKNHRQTDAKPNGAQRRPNGNYNENRRRTTRNNRKTDGKL